MSNCDNCENYNQEKHYCPTYCEVIRNSCEENKQWYLDRLQAMREEIESISGKEHRYKDVAGNMFVRESDVLAIIDKYIEVKE